jgi:hypothetical protein
MPSYVLKKITVISAKITFYFYGNSVLLAKNTLLIPHHHHIFHLKSKVFGFGSKMCACCAACLGFCACICL